MEMGKLFKIFVAFVAVFAVVFGSFWYIEDNTKTEKIRAFGERKDAALERTRDNNWGGEAISVQLFNYYIGKGDFQFSELVAEEYLEDEEYLKNFATVGSLVEYCKKNDFYSAGTLVFEDGTQLHAYWSDDVLDVGFYGVTRWCESGTITTSLRRMLILPDQTVISGRGTGEIREYSSGDDKYILDSNILYIVHGKHIKTVQMPFDARNSRAGETTGTGFAAVSVGCEDGYDLYLIEPDGVCNKLWHCSSEFEIDRVKGSHDIQVVGSDIQYIIHQDGTVYNFQIEVTVE